MSHLRKVFCIAGILFPWYYSRIQILLALRTLFQWKIDKKKTDLTESFTGFGGFNFVLCQLICLESTVFWLGHKALWSIVLPFEFWFRDLSTNKINDLYAVYIFSNGSWGLFRYYKICDL